MVNLEWIPDAYSSMDDITIRKATHADMETLLQFEQGVISAERPFDPTLKASDVKYYDLEGMLTLPHINLVVAQLNGEVIGSGYARVESAKPYLKHQQYAYLGFMYVLPQHRGKGVNKKVIASLTEWSAKQGITELRLEVYFENAPAIKAYEKVGFNCHMLTMRKGL